MLDAIVNIEDGEIAKFLETLPNELTGATAREKVSEAAAESIRAHFKKLHATRHRGVTSRSFYSRAAESVVAAPTSKDARVEIDHTGLALRYYGGRVEPTGKTSLITGKPITRLAIPVKGSEAEGKTPYDMRGADLKLGFGKTALYLGKPTPGGKGKLTPMFWLVKHTDHKPDKSVLPTDDEIADAAIDAVGDYIEEVRRGQ